MRSVGRLGGKVSGNRCVTVSLARQDNQEKEKEAPVKEFTTAVEDIVAEDDGVKAEDQYVEFKLDGREMRAYPPTDGQLAFMLAAMGRGQTSDQRFAAIINIMLSSLRDDDRDYMESRLLTRDPKVRLPVKRIEEIFTFLTSEWFARPTQPSSGSVPSPPSDGQN